MTSRDLVPRKPTAATLLSAEQTGSLVAWCNLYMSLEATAGSENTAEAKRRDLNRFLDFFAQAVSSDHLDYWTRPTIGRNRLQSATSATWNATSARARPASTAF